MEKVISSDDKLKNSTDSGKLGGDSDDVQKHDSENLSQEMSSLDMNTTDFKSDEGNGEYVTSENIVKQEQLREMNENKDSKESEVINDISKVESVDKTNEDKGLQYKDEEGTEQIPEEMLHGEELEPVFDGTEVPGMEASRSTSFHDYDSEGSAWPEKAVALKNFVKDKGVVAVAKFLRVLSGNKEEQGPITTDEDIEASDLARDRAVAEVSQKQVNQVWNPLNYIMVYRDLNSENKTDQGVEVAGEPPPHIVTKGRIIVYTRLGCQNCRRIRLFLHRKRLRYVEINIDVYPSRKAEIEKFTGSVSVPKVLFNEVVIGGMDELLALEQSDKLEEKIDYLINESPSFEAPLPPLSGEDDLSSSGSIDEFALIVRKMKESIVVKDRFHKMRRFVNSFLGMDAVDFLSEDQYLEREEAIEFGRKLASKLFFRHVLDENLFEDGNHLYRFLDDDPIVSSQCHNIPRGIIEAKPKPIAEIASRLRFLSYAIFEAYTSEDGRHVDYRSIHGSEEFARYLRIIQELQRVELQDMPREEKLAFFINLYNMMAIHAILVLGYPTGALERRKLLGDFKYVISGNVYSLSAIQNGILRGNQRPPYNLMKTFTAKDKRYKVALPYPEPLTHFALVCGSRSGPALRCYSPGNIDMELMEAARNFLRSGGLVLDLNAKVVYVSKILNWYSVDFGKNEVEVLKHASNYLESNNSETLLDLLAKDQLKVIYQPYDWGLNC